MMRLLPMKESKEREREPVISLVCGVPALSIGLGAMILLSSHLGSAPTGSEKFYTFENVGVEERDRMGRIIIISPVIRLLPSMQLLWMLCVGACLAGLGIHLSRRRWPHRRATTSIAGIIACAMAFFLAWILFVVAAFA